MIYLHINKIPEKIPPLITFKSSSLVEFDFLVANTGLQAKMLINPPPHQAETLV
ncbi:hypothetical protein X474_04060 [Dethiosulfatarculus sandiegensis]|uniref:Uncharacterized protein n=1 Tax=Dethiosulfatarculus sandiegensis TaxID=1429043 RepID=A0A0D2GL89_9BACT|nr:hypothetical protein X474_04060 [Dethiosulfatarculus sandiegensis]